MRLRFSSRCLASRSSCSLLLARDGLLGSLALLGALLACSCLRWSSWRRRSASWRWRSASCRASSRAPAPGVPSPARAAAARVRRRSRLRAAAVAGGGGGGACTTGGGGGGASTGLGAACCTAADQISASTAMVLSSRFHFRPQLRASTSTACASSASPTDRRRPGWGGGVNSGPWVRATIRQRASCTDRPTRCTPARCSVSMVRTTVSYLTLRSALMTTAVEPAGLPAWAARMACARSAAATGARCRRP
jgi:hypothetical protein